MYGYYREKFHVNHIWELKGYNLQRNVSRAKFYLIGQQLKMLLPETHRRVQPWTLINNQGSP